MSIITTLISKLKSIIRLSPPQTRMFSVETSLDRYARAFLYRLWYHGDGYELDQFYSQMEKTACRFWGNTATKGMEIRKCHTGLPQIIVDTLSAIVVRDLNGINFNDTKADELWGKIEKENNMSVLCEAAVKDALIVGDGAFKLCFDATLGAKPVIEWYGGDRCVFSVIRGRIRSIVFMTEIEDFTLYEIYGYGFVRYELYKTNDREKKQKYPLSTLPETKELCDVEFDDKIMLAVPLIITASDRDCGRGKSVYAAKCDAFDALDEVWSQWLAAMRASRAVRYIPESLIPHDLKTGEPLKSNPFDCSFIKIGDDNHEGGRNEITVSQPQFNSEQYTATYITALDMALQGIISPSTLGIDVKKLDNAEAQREKEKTTLYTRNRIIAALEKALKTLAETALSAYYAQTGDTSDVPECTVTFGEYANPSFEAVVETLSNPNTPMSVEAKVDELWGDTKTDEWKAAEVERIRSQSGTAFMEGYYE